MRRWELTLTLDSRGGLPLFPQLASGIADDIRRGRLKPGDPLPGTRELAKRLGVNRNTIVAGYEELCAEGLVCARTGGGTFVAHPPAAPAAAPVASLAAPTFSLGTPLVPPLEGMAPAPGVLVMSLGVPDVRLLPARSLARAFRRAIGRQGRANLTYADPRGHRRLRAELATMLSRTRGIVATPDEHRKQPFPRLGFTYHDEVELEQAVRRMARALERLGRARTAEARLLAGPASR